MTYVNHPPSRSRRRVLVLLALVALGALVAVGAYVFQPWKLFIDDVVNEAFPVAAPPPAPSGGAPAPTPLQPYPLAVGSFQSLDHPASGTATVYQVPNSGRVLRFEGFSTDNGPDLFVYLTSTGVGGEVGDGVNLGALKGNIGDQNYDIPAQVDLSTYRTVVIWCRQFNSSFGAAGLAPA